MERHISLEEREKNRLKRGRRKIEHKWKGKERIREVQPESTIP